MLRSVLLLSLLLACAPPEPADAPAVVSAPPPGALSLTASPAAAGYTLTLAVTGADPSTRYHLFRSTRGPGAGPCLPAAPATCLGLASPQSIFTGRTDAAGDASNQRLLGGGGVSRFWVQAAGTVQGVVVTSAVVRVDVAAQGIDNDGDGLTDADEVGLYGTDPTDRDTDGDFARDGVEVRRGLDPLNADQDADGLVDGFDLAPRQVGPYDTFTVMDDVVSDPRDSLPDPEFEDGRLVWEHDDGSELWAAEIDPATGAIVPPDGRGERIATHVLPVNVARNGPEWMLSAAGPEALYAKEVGGVAMVHRASPLPAGGWQSVPVVGTEEGVGPIGSLDAGDLTPRTMYMRMPPGAPNPVLYAREIDDPLTETFAPAAIDFPRWIPHQRAITGVVDRQGLDMVVQWNIDTGAVTDLTADGVDHGSVFFFEAPELGGERLFFTTNAPVPDEPEELGVWRRVGGVWRETRRITMPPAYPYVVSPEPFIANGRAYVSFIASTEPLNSGNGRAVVYIATLVPGNDLIRRVSDDSVMVRKDPESYTFGVQPWIYYTEVDQAGRRVLHRCETGL